MERALVIGASGGVGSAVSEALQAQGVAVTEVSRRTHGLDWGDLAGASRVLSEVEGPFDLVFVASGILAPEGQGPEKSLDAIDPAAMAEVMAVNAIGPALVLQHAPRLLPREGRSVFAVLTARVGSIGDNGLGGWYSYRASKAAANQIVRTAAIEIGRKRKEAVVVAMHPGTVETPFTAGFSGHPKVSAEEAAGNLLRVIGELTAEQSGGFYDYAGDVVPW